MVLMSTAFIQTAKYLLVGPPGVGKTISLWLSVMRRLQRLLGFYRSSFRPGGRYGRGHRNSARKDWYQNLSIYLAYHR